MILSMMRGDYDMTSEKNLTFVKVEDYLLDYLNLIL